MPKLFRSTRSLIRSDLFRNFTGGFAVGAVALFGLAGKAEACVGMMF